MNRLDLSKFNFDNVKEINTMFLLTNISELVLPTMNKANIKGVNELIALCRIGKIIGSFDIDISRADVLANSLGIFHQMTLHSDLDLSGFCPNGRIEVFRGGQIHGKVTFNNYKFNGGRDLKRMLTCLASGAKTIDEIEIPLENLSNYTKEELDDITNETNMIYRYDGDKVRFIYIL